MQTDKKYWELSQESTLTDRFLRHAIRVNFRPPRIPSPVADSQESAAVIVM
jgi:hypothetical protein